MERFEGLSIGSESTESGVSGTDDGSGEIGDMLQDGIQGNFPRQEVPLVDQLLQALGQGQRVGMSTRIGRCHHLILTKLRLSFILSSCKRAYCRSMVSRRILAATDDSPAGSHAVARATHVSKVINGQMEILQVVSGPRAPQSVPDDGRRVCTGIPGIEIVHRAEAFGANLLILGRHLRGALGKPHLGPTADAVVRRSPVPCLFVPVGQTGFGDIVVALDGTERGFRVLECAERVYPWLEAKWIRVVTVEPLRHRDATTGEAYSPSGREVRLQGWMESRETGIAQPDDLTVHYGDPVGGVLGMIGHPEGSLLVVGYHRGGPAGVVTSTGVGRALLYTAPCAVLTVPL